MKVVGDKVGWYDYHNHRDGFVQWAGGFGQMEYSKGRWTAFVNVSGVANGYKGVDYFMKKELNLGDTTLFIGAGDTLEYNGVTFDQSTEGLTYNQTPWMDWWFYPKIWCQLQLDGKVKSFCQPRMVK